MTKARNGVRARGEFPRLNISADTRAAFNELLAEAPRLGLDPERVEAAGLPGLRALLALKQAAESRSPKNRDAHLAQLQGTLRLLQYRRHPELVQQLQARAMALQGRGGDTEVAHVTVGEIVLPRALQTRAVIEALGRAAGEAGIPLAYLRVGSGRNSINPHTGLPEFADSSEEITVTAPREADTIQDPISTTDSLGLNPSDSGDRSWWDPRRYLPDYNRAEQIANEERAQHHGHNDADDAQRHADWSRRMQMEIGPFTAWSAGVGHELANLLEGGPLRESLMDLHNNAEGRAAARENRAINPNNLRTNPSRSGGAY